MNIAELLERWDGRDVRLVEDTDTGATFIIAVHSVREDRAIGGTRMKHYPDLAEALRDAQRLAGGMTLKWAAAGISAGGAKAVIALPSGFDPLQRGDLLRRFGREMSGLDGLFRTGPDLGTSSEDMDVIAETAPGLVFGRTQAAGGAGDPAPFTATGVLTAMQVVADRVFGAGGLAGLRVLLQGMGNVARQLVSLLQDEGAVVMFSDIDADVARHFAGQGLDYVPAERVYQTDCEIFAPCAVGGTINAQSIPELRCAAVVGAANNQLGAAEDAQALRDRGIVYAPDFVANCGGAIALIGIETDSMDRRQAMDAVIQAVRNNLTAILDEAEGAASSTDSAARRLAQARIAVG